MAECTNSILPKVIGFSYRLATPKQLSSKKSNRILEALPKV